ncbi:MAG: metallopeptidase TldD-related protein [Myxococcota bacterium]
MKRTTALRLIEVMQAELTRAKASIRVPRRPKPYFLSYLLREEEFWACSAKYGALLTSQHTRSRNCYADIRVGNYRDDQVGDGGLIDNSNKDESYGYVPMPVEGSMDGLRHALWRLTEARYREAVYDMLRKQSETMTFIDENAHLPAFEKRAAENHNSWRKLPDVDMEYYCNFVMKCSDTFKKYPSITNGSVSFEARHDVRLFASTEGTVGVQCLPYYELQISILFLSEKGHAFRLGKEWFVTRQEELPSSSSIHRALRELNSTGQKLAAAPELSSFSGPVLLDPKPAGLLMHEALGHRLEGSRLRSHGEGHTFRDLLGEEVLPGFLSVHDDPSIAEFEGQSLVGHYLFDDEGVSSKRANLIQDGTLKGFLTTRSPIARKQQSNGHARNSYHERPISRMGNTFVESTQGLTDEALREAFVEEIRRQGAPYGIRVLDATGGETTTGRYDFQAFLGDIRVASRIFPDGREEMIRGVDFVGTPLNAVREITAVGQRREVDNSLCGAESGFLPVSTVSPALMIARLELQNKAERPYTSYTYPIPWEK